MPPYLMRMHVGIDRDVTWTYFISWQKLKRLGVIVLGERGMKYAFHFFGFDNIIIKKGTSLIYHLGCY